MIVVIRSVPEKFKICTYPGVADNLYLISNYGGIRKIYDTVVRYPTSTNSQGYPHTSLITNQNKKYIDVLIHRLVAWEFVNGYSEKDGRVYVNHRNSNKMDYYFENLEWVTVSENQKHAYTYGHKIPSIPNISGPRPKIRGIRNPNNKFPEEEVRRICTYFENGKNVKDIMKIYNSTKKSNQKLYTLIMNLKHRKCWHEITRDYKY